MSENQTLLEELILLLKRKKSNLYYAEKLNVSVGEVESLRKELKELKKETLPIKEEFILGETTKKTNVEKGTIESTIESSFEPKDDIELAKLHKINLDKYKISNYWTKQKPNGNFFSSVFATLIKENSKENITNNFIEFLKTFKPSSSIIKKEINSNKNKISLIFPKQDAHYNKFDEGGNNDINQRFTKDQNCVLNMLKKADAINNIQEIVYIIGSDQFNSEWTNLTTKGTPQSNIYSYQESFKLITNHEIQILNTLLTFSEKVKVIFIPGNHDEYVGWNLINLLEVYYRNESNIEFDSSTENTKYHKFGNSAIMLNHGDAIKPTDLAQKFPIGFKHSWSQCDNYYIFTGDKHTELSMDIKGIKFYRVPQLSNAKSKWDDKQGYIDSKAEMTAFVITETNGMSDIYKELI